MDFAPLARPVTDQQSCPTVAGDARRHPWQALAPTPAPQPFAWQNGDQLLLMDVEGPHWVFAELRFVPTECRYDEVRRIAYQWPREAIGALLSRALASGDDALITTVEQLHSYMDRHFGIRLMDC